MNSEKIIRDAFRLEINKLNDIMNRLEDKLREIYEIYIDDTNVDEWIEKIKRGEDKEWVRKKKY